MTLFSRQMIAFIGHLSNVYRERQFKKVQNSTKNQYNSKIKKNRILMISWFFIHSKKKLNNSLFSFMG